MTKYLYEDLSEKIIGCFYNVFNELGFGFLESVYENALMIELNKININAIRQQPIEVLYKGQIVGDFRADIIVDNKIIIELKAVSKLSSIHEVQLVNYLKATEIKIGLLVNFGEKLEFRRRIF
ncbi:MAG: GxxExxY protein [Candidatus Cloacimonetes bacterium]|nr:GxxExxY protein [Candidatus Cloacimonadota bacterium]